MVFSRHSFFLTSKFRARIERNLPGAASNQSQRLRPTPRGESNKRTMRDEEGTQEGDEEKRQVAFTNRDHSRRGVRDGGRPAFVFCPHKSSADAGARSADTSERGCSAGCGRLFILRPGGSLLIVRGPGRAAGRRSSCKGNQGGRGTGRRGSPRQPPARSPGPGSAPSRRGW